MRSWTPQAASMSSVVSQSKETTRRRSSKPARRAPAAWLAYSQPGWTRMRNRSAAVAVGMGGIVTAARPGLALGLARLDVDRAGKWVRGEPGGSLWRQGPEPDSPQELDHPPESRIPDRIWFVETLLA